MAKVKAAPLPENSTWTLGLINSSRNYLTAEKFGFKINANGKTMKKNQMWELEGWGDGKTVCLKSSLGRFMAVDKHGNVRCDLEEKDDSAKLEMFVCEDFTARLAFKSVSRGNYLGASADELVCQAKVPGEAELWAVNMAARPQVTLYSLGRKRFARLAAEGDRVQVDEVRPWGSDALFTLQFQETERRYALQTSNMKFLGKDGDLHSTISKDCLYGVEVQGDTIALRDHAGLYLSPGSGAQAVLKTKSAAVTKSEQFTLEDSQPQATLQSVASSKYVSVMGLDVTANQAEVSDNETFQLEFVAATSKWVLRTVQDKYVSLGAGGGLQAGEVSAAAGAPLELVWLEGGAVALKADTGKLVTNKKSGHLFATADAVDERSKYFFHLINRPVLVLKCEQGYVGYRAPNSTKLDCNKANYATFMVEKAEQGQVHLKGSNGKYWAVVEGAVACDSATPQAFHMELLSPTKVLIKDTDGKYIVEKRNGGFNLGGDNRDEATRWEF